MDVTMGHPGGGCRALGVLEDYMGGRGRAKPRGCLSVFGEKRRKVEQMGRVPSSPSKERNGASDLSTCLQNSSEYSTSIQGAHRIS